MRTVIFLLLAISAPAEARGRSLNTVERRLKRTFSLVEARRWTEARRAARRAEGEARRQVEGGRLSPDDLEYAEQLFDQARRWEEFTNCHLSRGTDCRLHPEEPEMP